MRMGRERERGRDGSEAEPGRQAARCSRGSHGDSQKWEVMIFFGSVFIHPQVINGHADRSN